MIAGFNYESKYVLYEFIDGHPVAHKKREKCLLWRDMVHRDKI